MVPELPEYRLDQTLFDGATEQEHYTVIDSQYNNRPARILYTDHQTAAQSGLPFDDNPEMLFDYNERFMELVRGLKPASVLVIGGGAFTLPMSINKHFPDIQVDVFEIDSGLINIASRFFGFQERPNLKVYIGDGRMLLKTNTKKYDLIIVDVFNSVEIPVDFNRPDLPLELKSSLKSSGTLAMNIIASYHGARAETLKQLESSFKKAFSKIEIFPAGSSWSLWISQNFILVAGAKIKQAAEALQSRPL